MLQTSTLRIAADARISEAASFKWATTSPYPTPAQWMAAFCYPEGLMRWWAEFSMNEIEVLVTPQQVQLTAGVADNFVRKILIDQKHVMEVPQWYGESVGFWNGNHARRLDGQRAGLDAVALDAQVQQREARGHRDVHAGRERRALRGRSNVLRSRGVRPAATRCDTLECAPAASTTPRKRYTFVECRVQSTIVNGPDGRPTQLTFVDDGYIDYFGRPWAQNWEEHFEQGWTDEP